MKQFKLILCESCSMFDKRLQSMLYLNSKLFNGLSEDIQMQIKLSRP